MSILKILPIQSSSKGNSTLVISTDAKILVDCGISGKALQEKLLSSGISPYDIDAILITHEHTDHTKGIGIISRKYNLPIFANNLTWQSIGSSVGKITPENIRIFETASPFYIKDVLIKSFPIPHDAISPVGFTFESGGQRLAIATDMGTVTDEVLAAISGCDTVLLEANYDLGMLEVGTYPFELKKRIKSNVGHLCNDDAARLARILLENGTKKIYLGHLSQENNFPPLALKTVENALLDANAPPCVLSVITPEGDLVFA